MLQSYKILGCSPDSTDEEVRKCFKKKAMRLHPDRGGDDEKFDTLVKAFVFIIEHRKRVNNSKQDTDNFFKSFFGGKKPPFSGR